MREHRVAISSSVLIPKEATLIHALGRNAHRNENHFLHDDAPAHYKVKETCSKKVKREGSNW